MSKKDCTIIHDTMKILLRNLNKKIKASPDKRVKEQNMKAVRDHLENMIKDTDPDDVMTASNKAIENIKETTDKNFLDVINSHRSYQAAVKYLDGMIDGVTSVQGIEFAVQEFFQAAKLSTQRLILRLENNLDDMFLNPNVRNIADVEVQKIYKVYQNHRGGGNKLMEELEKSKDLPLKGDEAQRAIIETLSRGHFSKNGKSNVILTVIGNFHKKWDNFMTQIIGETNTPFKSRKGYSVPVEENQTIVYTMGKDKYKELALEEMDFDDMFRHEKHTMTQEKFDEFVDDWIDDRYVRITGTPEGGAPTKVNAKIDSHRVVTFKSFSNEHNYFKAVRPEGADVLNVAHDHKINMVRKAVVYETFGGDPAAAIKALGLHIKAKDNVQKAYGKGNVDQIGTHMEDLARQIGVLRTGSTAYDGVAQVTSDILSRIISAGLVRLSAVRDFFYDRTIHAAMMKSLFLGADNGAFLGTLKTMKEILIGARFGQRSGAVEGVFNDVGIATKLSVVSLIRGQEAVYDAAKNRTRNRALSGTNYVTNKVSAISLADATTRSSRVFESTNASLLIFRILETDYGKLGNIEKFYLARAGFDKTDFNDLKKAERIKFYSERRELAKGPRRVKDDGDRRIFDKGRDDEVNLRAQEGTQRRQGKPERRELELGSQKGRKDGRREKFMEGKEIIINAETIKSSKRGLATEKEADRVLAQKYLHLLESLTSDVSSVTTIHGTPLVAEGKLKPISQLITKFFAMPLSQYRALTNGIRASVGLDAASGLAGDVMSPGKLLSTKGGRIPVMKSAVGMMAGGILINMAADLSEGRIPELPDGPGDIGFFVDAMSQTGLGGLPAIAINDMYYSDDIISTPLQAYIDPVKDLVTAPTKKNPGASAGKAAARLAKVTPGVNLWYTRWFVNFLFDTGLEEHYRREHRRDEERGNEYFWRKR